VHQFGGDRSRKGQAGCACRDATVGCRVPDRWDGQVGQGTPPGGDALADEHAEPERERARACVQGGMTQLLVAGVQPAAGSMSPAVIRIGVRFSSRVAR
jgi:hypothetical protein